MKFPAIKGIMGDWIYYQTVIPFSVVSEIIDNDHSIREYDSLDDVLQRDLSKRSKKIKDYLIREETRFFNSVIIGIYGENPNWYNFDFVPSAIPDMDLSDKIINTIGLLEFHGGEKLFSIDGQHRIDGIKQAIDSNSEKFTHDELPVILIAHNDDKKGKIRTRRLFSEINTKAVKVSGLDDLITNEDNPVDINARKLYAEFDYFKTDKFISLSKIANIDPLSRQFTTIINLKEVNKILYKPFYTHKNFRPSDRILEDLFNISTLFWTDAINNIKEYKNIFINKTEKIDKYRNKSGGSMLFRPIGVKILAESYINWNTTNRNTTEFWKNFNKIDNCLNSLYWKDILWDNAKLTMKKVSEKFLREYSKYLMGLSKSSTYLYKEYNKMKGIENEADMINLPFV